MLSCVKVIPPEADGTYSLAEIAPLVGIAPGTLFRWRWSGRLLTTFDYLVDPDMAFRIAQAELLKQELSGEMPVARFNVEDCARLRIIGVLGDAGWDRARLLEALGIPRALPVETRDDGHTAASGMPRCQVIYAESPTRISCESFDTREEAEAFARQLAMAVLLDVDVFREGVRRDLAEIDRRREQKAAARAKAPKGNSAESEKERVKERVKV
jgi:hypothetical protein